MIPVMTTMPDYAQFLTAIDSDLKKLKEALLAEDKEDAGYYAKQISMNASGIAIWLTISTQEGERNEKEPKGQSR